MKKRRGIVGCLILIMFVATLVACASTSKQEGMGEYVDDSVVTAKVKSLLAADDFLKSFQIGVETYKGTVQLSGFVLHENRNMLALGKKLGFDIKRAPDSGDNELVIHFVSSSKQQ
jgi:hypothetical protein